MRGRPDFKLILLILGILGLGCLLVTNAGNGALGIMYRHFLAILLGLAGVWLVWKINPEFYQNKKLINLLLGVSIGLLVLVLVIGRGDENGVSRSLHFGWLEFQPAELAKWVLVLFLARYFSKRLKGEIKFSSLIVPVLVFGVLAVLIAKQPALGTILVMGTAFLFYLIICNVNWKYWVPFLALAAVIAGCMVWFVPYRRDRMVNFLTRQNLLGTNYQVYQSQLAIGSGRILGKGLNRGVQKHFIPAVHTDCIFAIVGEEFGLWGCLLVLFSFLLLFKRGIKVALDTHNQFLALFGSGIIFVITAQAVLNIGVVLWLFPCTGVPLPLLSYGGSALSLTIVMLGILVKISAYDPREKLMQETEEPPVIGRHLREVSRIG